MSAEGKPSTQLPRALTLRDLVLFNVVAVMSMRWLATSATAGPSALTLWVLAALLFFIPLGLAVSELAARFPEEGGIYFWTKRAFGERHGFLCGWCYWVNNILYYPNLLLSTAVIATFVVGKGESGLGDNWTYVLTATLMALWGAVALNIVGLRTGKWLQNVGAIGAYLPGVVLVGLGIYAALTHPAANTFTLEALAPDFSNVPALNLWASIAFAFSGLELSATMGGEIVDPRRALPRSIYIAAPLIAFLYVVGTASVLWLVPVPDLHIVSGFFQAITQGMRFLSGGLDWFVPLAAASYCLGTMGGVGAWLTGPARVAFVIGLDRYFPSAFGKVHPRWKTPYVAILVQASLATLFLLLSLLGKGTTVERAYLILLDTMLLIYFIPYIYLFVCYLILGGRNSPTSARSARTSIVGISGLLLTLFAMVVATIPPPETAEPWLFRAKVIGGAAAFVLLGGIFYWWGSQRDSVRT